MKKSMKYTQSCECGGWAQQFAYDLENLILIYVYQELEPAHIK